MGRNSCIHLEKVTTKLTLRNTDDNNGVPMNKKLALYAKQKYETSCEQLKAALANLTRKSINDPLLEVAYEKLKSAMEWQSILAISTVFQDRISQSKDHEDLSKPAEKAQDFKL